MIIIDGDYGSGGGQILRTAIGLAALTGKACRIEKVRAKRPHPGLREQHLQAIKAVASICEGKLEGAEIGSTEVEFYPGQIKSDNIFINISTAGSIGLVLQALLIPAMQADLNIKIKGGATYGKWAPPISYLQNVIFPLLNKMGYQIRLKILREGFYPRGGAEVKVKTKKAKLKTLEITSKGEIINIRGISTASLSLKNSQVAERQAEVAKRVIARHLETAPDTQTRYCDTACPGSGIQLWAETENSILGGNALGERGKRAEVVGKEAAESLIYEYDSGEVDSHAADQLLPYLAIGKGRIKVSQVTEHCRTNAFIIEKFLAVKFKIVKDTIAVT
ncbi:RNA 3'-terminal phosphate cyclase [candidate division NPL-UPA2 bacterium]|nr:RNA 3'-terminal phosphate cyclase [candidate division NPL-UPA2 bacterium]